MGHVFHQFLLGLGLLVILGAGDTAAAIEAGQPAPDFTMQSLDGRHAIRLTDFRGRRVLIFIWASW